MTDDDDIESTVSIRVKRTSQESSTITELAQEGESSLPEGLDAQSDTSVHGLDRLGLKASCRMSNVGPTNCAICLSTQVARIMEEMGNQEHHLLLQRVLNILDEAKSTGVTKAELMVSGCTTRRCNRITYVSRPLSLNPNKLSSAVL